MNCFCVSWKKVKAVSTDKFSRADLQRAEGATFRPKKHTKLREFSVFEVKKACRNFSSSLLIGRGVYKGSIELDEGSGILTDVAIKTLPGLRAFDEWITSYHTHGVVDHRNLVKLLGYSSVDGGTEGFLLYEYMPNGSLESHLLDKTLPALSWVARLRIMLGVAKGLHYLHLDWVAMIIYGDFKPSNVLLNENFWAKLSGLPLLRNVSTQVVEREGCYMAPEYIHTGHLSLKCDIYSYGVVLYQVLTGRPVLDEQQHTTPEHNLLEWVKQIPPSKMIMDSRLQNQYSRSAAVKLANLADECTRKNPKDRPNMGEIVATLEEAIMESEKSGGNFHSDLSLDGLQYLSPSCSAQSIHNEYIQEALADLDRDIQSETSSESSFEIIPTKATSCPAEIMPASSTADYRMEAEHSHPAPREYYCGSSPYGIEAHVQPSSISVAHHPHIDATRWENQGAYYNEQRLSNRVLDLEKEVQGKKILFLFGGGCEFEKEMLIQLWMALDILNDEPMEGIGANYFEKLVSEGYVLCSNANSLYKVNTKKLNIELDMVTNKRDYMILDNGRGYDAASAETLHASVLCDEIDALMFKTLGGCRWLRTLLFLGNYGSRLQQVPRDLFLCYESLEALDLSGTHIKELPSSIAKMTSLRYLNISWTYIEVLPERIDRFEKLQTLKLEGCSRLRRLPKEMKGLIGLRHLHMDVLRQLTAFPEGLGALINIRTLSAFPVGTKEGLKISELKYLNNIMGEFCIAKLENVLSADEAKEASLTAKRNIRKLKLRWSGYPLQEPTNEHESILQNLCPHSELEEIHILCYPGISFPDWVANVSFHKLASISLFRCVHATLLPSLEKLPSLKYLELVSLNSVTLMDCKGEVGHVSFPKLEKLAVDEMLNVQTWTEAQDGSYPSLVELSIKGCPNLLELPSLLYLPSIRNLELSGCTKLAFVSEKELASTLQQLIAEGCPLIEERCSKEGGEDWHKIQHIPTIWIDQIEIQTHTDA